jgi:hypothetical protein
VSELDGMGAANASPFDFSSTSEAFCPSPEVIELGLGASGAFTTIGRSFCIHSAMKLFFASRTGGFTAGTTGKFATSGTFCFSSKGTVRASV